jgi:alpha,alpha-trehalase
MSEEHQHVQKHLVSHDDHDAGADHDAEEHDDGPPPEYECHRRALFSCLIVAVSCVILSVAYVLRSTSSSPSSNAVPPVTMPQCSHPIYCTGPLLEAVQTQNIFPDCKTFVDMPMRYPADVILQDFSTQKGNSGFNLTKFVFDHFDPAGSEVVLASPEDYVQYPPAYASIVDPKLRQFAFDVHAIWPQLFRRHNASMYCGQPCVSSILVNNTFVVPGGRFREFYYWDTYWIVRGLLASAMVNSTRAILLNLLGIVDTYGFMPNGGRVYYTDRSQPPLLTQMVKVYIDVTGDSDMLEYALPILDREHRFWMQTHSIDDYNVSHVLSRYNVLASGPRPESFREDIATMKTSRRGPEIFSDLAAGAETGWDYSSRFLADGLNLSTIDTTLIAPVDLNAILLLNEETMKKWYGGSPGFESVRNATKRMEYAGICELRAEAIMFHLRDLGSTFGAAFQDKNMYTGELRQRSWYPSSLLPALSTGVLNRLDLNVLKAMADGIVLDAGGVPTSLLQTGQQWDMPNAWAPLQMFVIDVLQVVASTVSKLDRPRYHAKLLAVAQAWVETAYCGFKNYPGMMFEKYDVRNPGQPGGGGEYTVQAGFGWTNGVVLELLARYGNQFTIPPEGFKCDLGKI